MLLVSHLQTTIGEYWLTNLIMLLVSHLQTTIGEKWLTNLIMLLVCHLQTSIIGEYCLTNLIMLLVSLLLADCYRRTFELIHKLGLNTTPRVQRDLKGLFIYFKMLIMSELSNSLYNLKSSKLCIFATWWYKPFIF